MIRLSSAYYFFFFVDFLLAFFVDFFEDFFEAFFVDFLEDFFVVFVAAGFGSSFFSSAFSLLQATNATAAIAIHNNFFISLKCVFGV